MLDNGNIYQILDVLNGNNSQAFTYDTLNRLSAFANGGGNMQQTYSIDPWGNLSQTGTMSSVVSFGTNNRITTPGYGYDSSGNLTSFYNGVGTTTYAYDAEGQMTTVNNDWNHYLAEMVFDCTNSFIFLSPFCPRHIGADISRTSL